MGSQHENIDARLHRNRQTRMEYGSNAWSTAAMANVNQLRKAQNARLRIITGDTKTSPISEVERTAGLLSLEE